jgi:hypothetical protein
VSRLIQHISRLTPAARRGAVRIDGPSTPGVH